MLLFVEIGPHVSALRRRVPHEEVRLFIADAHAEWVRLRASTGPSRKAAQTRKLASFCNMSVEHALNEMRRRKRGQRKMMRKMIEDPVALQDSKDATASAGRSEIELLREANIRANNERLRELGLF